MKTNRRFSKADIARMSQGKMPIATEDETQTTIVQGLRAHGYLVLVTSRRAKKCWHCGQWPKSGSGDGVSKGVSDLLCRRQTWPMGVWVALEVKRPGPVKWSSKEQELLAETGDVIVVQSLEDALQACADHGLDAEVRSLHQFILRLSERLLAAADVLARLAERKDAKK